MDSQLPSYNPKERKLEISSKISPLLETLDRKLQETVRKMGKNSNINNADRVYVNMELANSGGKFSMYTGKAFFVNDKGEDAGKCYFIVDDFLTNDVICSTAENKYYETRDYELRDIEKIVRDLSNIINEQKGLSNSPYWMVLYADIKGINSGQESYDNPKIEIDPRQDGWLITYNRKGSEIHLFLSTNNFKV
jgi:hypothetical protein